MKTINFKPLLLIVIVLLSSVSTGCSTISPPETLSSLSSSEPVQTPSLPPSLAKPVPPHSYLDSAQEDIELWRQRLTSSRSK